MEYHRVLIIIEGADRTGKTTLAQNLATRLNGTARHAGVPTEHPLVEYEWSLIDYDPRRSRSLILDRFHLGEHVWPEVFGRSSDLTPAVARHVELFLRSRGAQLVYAERDASVLGPELDAADEPITSAELPRVLQLFEEALDFSAGVTATWNFNLHGEEQLRRITRVARLKRQDVSPIWDALGDGEWVGDPYPSFLLVGDEFGPAKPGRPDIPLPFGPWPATSGRYLLESLPEHGWRDYALVNARVGRTGERRDTLKPFWEALGSPRVLALGYHAAGALADQGVPFEHVPHPQYWRRFQHHNRDEYTRMLAGEREEVAC